MRRSNAAADFASRRCTSSGSTPLCRERFRISMSTKVLISAGPRGSRQSASGASNPMRCAGEPGAGHEELRRAEERTGDARSVQRRQEDEQVRRPAPSPAPALHRRLAAARERGEPPDPQRLPRHQRERPHCSRSKRRSPLRSRSTKCPRSQRIQTLSASRALWKISAGQGDDRRFLNLPEAQLFMVLETGRDALPAKGRRPVRILVKGSTPRLAYFEKAFLRSTGKAR